MMQINKDFYSIFRKNEFKALKGNNNRNFLVLISVLFGTFLAVGFSNGSLKYLKNKMSSPFVNWVDITVPYRIQDNIFDFLGQLKQEDVRAEFYIDDATGYHRFIMNFWDPTRGGSFHKIGRSIDLTDKLLLEIFKSENLITGRPFSHQRDFGLVVTTAMLEELNYDMNSLYIYTRWRIEGDNFIETPMPIIAVVKDLPGMHRFAVTPNTYSIITGGDRRGNIFTRIPIEEKQLFYFVPGESEDALRLKALLEQQQTPQRIISARVEPNADTYRKGNLVIASFRPQPFDYSEIQSLHQGFENAGVFNEFKHEYYRYHNYHARLYEVNQHVNYDNISVNFNSLGKIRDFSNFLIALNYRGMEIDIAQVEAKENYDFISKLTIIISFVLIIFSIYAVSVFLRSVLRMHLEKIKMNLGTFLAFGIEPATLKNIYLLLMLRFIIISLVIALALSWIAGTMGGMRFVFAILQLGVEEGEKYFQLWSYLTLFSIILIASVSFYSLNGLLKKILSKPPGILIYNRD